ncbi:MAG TPA: alpha/beta-hydrolase family protein [Gammaproteobacteria bacterium]
MSGTIPSAELEARGPRGTASAAGAEPDRTARLAASGPLPARVQRIGRRLARTVSWPGLVLGTLFFAFSLTPSLLPRSALMQGFVSGFSLAAGYALGVLGRAVWRYLELPALPRRVARPGRVVVGVACALTAAFFAWRASAWQDTIRALMGMEPSEGSRPFTIAALALVVFAVVLLIGRSFRLMAVAISRFLARYVPRRVSLLVGVLAAAAAFWSLIDGVLVRAVLGVVDGSFQRVDALIEPETEQPQDPLRSGSPASALAWEDLGRAGREFIAGGPSRADLRAFFGEDVDTPIRVYVGLNSAETVEERSRLALEELERTGAFERSVLVVITPTGTGWVDPGAIDTVEYLHRGDIASVAVQYSYLASAFALLLEPEHGAETARALFADVYDRWTRLPRDRRPALYLHGLSLGAFHSDASFSVYDVIGDPFQGVLWSGPPFRTETWRRATERRVPGSPAWLPRFRDSTVIRFTDQHDRLYMPGVPWGPLRIAFLQYASDPITFFEPSMAYRPPQWLSPPRGPDVSPELRWIPIVTMLQLGADMRGGAITPEGHGHNFAPDDYIEAWLALTEPRGWSDDDTRRLKALFAARGPNEPPP